MLKMAGIYHNISTFSCYFLLYLPDDFGIGSDPMLVEINRSILTDFNRAGVGLWQAEWLKYLRKIAFYIPKGINSTLILSSAQWLDYFIKNLAFANNSSDIIITKNVLGFPKYMQGCCLSFLFCLILFSLLSVCRPGKGSRAQGRALPSFKAWPFPHYHFCFLYLICWPNSLKMSDPCNPEIFV